MCGIVGIFDTRARREVSRELVSRMNESQHHRGPDEERPARRARRRSRPPAAVDHRPVDRPAAAVQRGRQRRHRLQRRDLQLPGADPRADGARPRLPHDAATPRSIVHAWEAVGRALRRALPRHVRVRAVGPQPRDAVPRARPARREAALLRAAPRRHVAVRLGAEVAARARRAAARHRSLRGRGVFRARLRARAAHDLRRGAQAAAGAHADRAPRRGRRPTPREYWDVRFTLDRAIARADASREELAARLRRIGPPADDLGSAARRLPVRRRRLERGRRDDGAALSTRAGQHLLDRVRRSGLRRIALRPRGRGPLPHAALRRSRRERRLRPDRHARARLRRAVRRQLGDSDLPRLPARAPARDGGAVGRRRRRELRRLPALPPAPDGGADARGCCPLSRAPPAVRAARARVSEGRLGAARVPREDDVRGAGAQLGRGLLPQRVDPARGDAPPAVHATRFRRGSAATTRSRCSAATRARPAPTIRWR